MTDLADRQAAASRQGKAFEDTVELLLLVEGWTINDRHWRHPEVDVSGYWQARVVVSGPTGAGQVKLPKGTYAVYVQVVDSPEQPAFVLDTLIVT